MLSGVPLPAILQLILIAPKKGIAIVKATCMDPAAGIIELVAPGAIDTRDEIGAIAAVVADLVHEPGRGLERGGEGIVLDLGIAVDGLILVPDHGIVAVGIDRHPPLAALAARGHPLSFCASMLPLRHQCRRAFP